jgi:hypothetical protein
MSSRSDPILDRWNVFQRVAAQGHLSLAAVHLFELRRLMTSAGLGAWKVPNGDILTLHMVDELLAVCQQQPLTPRCCGDEPPRH